jgi:hypothetical protein
VLLDHVLARRRREPRVDLRAGGRYREIRQSRTRKKFGVRAWVRALIQSQNRGQSLEAKNQEDSGPDPGRRAKLFLPRLHSCATVKAEFPWRSSTMPVPNDLRDYLEAIESIGQLKRIKAQVDWDLEIGTVLYEVMKGPNYAVLFENIKGCPKDFRFLSSA